MTVSNDRLDQWALHPIHGALLAGTIPLFLGGLLSDFAYSSSYHIQWANFAAWLIAGGLVFGGFAFVWSIVHLVRHRGPFAVIYTLLLLTTWILGFLNSLIHAKDAWASMPAGLTLSLIVVLLACASTWLGFAKFGVGGAR